jgi:hypothetical protein
MSKEETCVEAMEDKNRVLTEMVLVKKPDDFFPLLEELFPENAVVRNGSSIVGEMLRCSDRDYILKTNISVETVVEMLKEKGIHAVQEPKLPNKLSIRDGPIDIMVVKPELEGLTLQQYGSGLLTERRFVDGIHNYRNVLRILERKGLLPANVEVHPSPVEGGNHWMPSARTWMINFYEKLSFDDKSLVRFLRLYMTYTKPRHKKVDHFFILMMVAGALNKIEREKMVGKFVQRMNYLLPFVMTFAMKLQGLQNTYSGLENFIVDANGENVVPLWMLTKYQLTEILDRFCECGQDFVNMRLLQPQRFQYFSTQGVSNKLYLLSPFLHCLFHNGDMSKYKYWNPFTSLILPKNRPELRKVAEFYILWGAAVFGQGEKALPSVIRFNNFAPFIVGKMAEAIVCYLEGTDMNPWKYDKWNLAEKNAWTEMTLKDYESLLENNF